jgi:hypothetical protein
MWTPDEGPVDKTVDKPVDNDGSSGEKSADSVDILGMEKTGENGSGKALVRPLGRH